MARIHCAVAAAYSWRHFYSYVAIGAGSLGWEMAVGTFALARCAGCTVDGLFPRIVAIPFSQSLTRMLLIFRCIQPDSCISVMLNVNNSQDTYLTLVFVRVNELCSVAGDFGLGRSCVLFGPVQGDLYILNVRVENRIKIPR